MHLSKQLLTNGRGIECIGAGKSENCTTRRKKGQLFMRFGSRLDNLALLDGFVDRSRFGHHNTEDTQTGTRREVRMQDKVANKVACAPFVFIAGGAAPWSSKDILCNYIYMDAKIKLRNGGEFILACLFRLAKKELSRLSVELAVASHTGTSAGIAFDSGGFTKARE